MTGFKEKFKPAVPKKVLLLIVGAMWFCAGIMLSIMAVQWLYAYEGNPLFFALTGIVAALFIHHFGFLKIVDKNLGRITRLPERPCIFSFISWKSYFIILLMVGMGIILRHSALPRQYLSVIYFAMGLSLIFSSTRYFRNLFLNN